VRQCESRSILAAPHKIITDPTNADIHKAMLSNMAKGYEGAMVKRLSAGYNHGRTDDVLKVKSFKDVDGRVLSVHEGKGRNKGRLGYLKFEHDGVVTEVGSGFTDKEREEVWADQDSYLNRIVEVQYQNKTRTGSLRFPVFVRFRADRS
jgi:DNA ligase-1